ncbi:hypothetical protein AGABI2DRAFT_64546, partial [Agaricus bisporus var. bisporus H97]|uniref:hypothetical protein n=1 Tax=Agaricus bisporus var. bisporus (strain H97 / ATCC MYA-4626 / FGSC 10389) TaxID=936046 RepID=UPI00029F6268
LSLQGSSPLPGHPKTLRDLTHASDLLTLPPSFGTIQLGQTFSGCLCVNNEATFSVDSIRVRIEMQTVTSKTLLFLTQEPQGRTLSSGDTLELIVSNEIKELGQHVLACTVTYRLPPNVRPIAGASEDPKDPALATFRKFYKFIVTNPLAVKTKVHPVRSPTALLSPEEREKIFLEIHIQNVTQDTMHFERLSFEPTEEWQVQDPNFTSNGQSIFSGPIALVNPQDVRQYIFILSPTSTAALRPLAVHPPGSIFPLGRLNIVWRSSYGEPGRLLTSMLTRRIPLINPGPSSQQPQHSHPVSAVPPYLKRVSAPIPSRPQSPGPHSRPNTPPPRHLQSPTPGIQSQQPTTPISNFQVHLTLREPLPSSTKVEEPFTLRLTLHVNTTSPGLAARPHLFAIQHVLHSVNRQPLSPLAPTQIPAELTSPRKTLSVLSSGFSTPTAVSGRGTPGVPQGPGMFNYPLARQKLLGLTPRQESLGEVALSGFPGEEEEDAVIYPSPYPLVADENNSCSSSVVPIGASSLSLPPLVFTSRLIPPHPASSSTSSPIHTSHPSTSSIDSFDSSIQESQPLPQLYSSSDFEVAYIPLSAGFHNVGGLRVLYLGEGEATTSSSSQEGSSQPTALAIQTHRNPQSEKRKAHIVKEYNIVAEILVCN